MARRARPRDDRPMIADGIEVRSRWRWLKLLALGALTWVAAVVALAATRDPNLIPLTVTTGSFAVPVCGAVYVVDRLFDGAFPRIKIVEAFALGGTFGVLIAAVGEYALLGRGPLQFVGVGLIEEASKLAALCVVARRLARYTERDGIVLGVAVGFGFAAFESSGYALVALFSSQGLSLHEMVSTVIERGLLAPVAHGLWTGILGGVLFRVAATRGRLSFTSSVLAAYIFVAVLHAFYDSASGIAALLVGLLTGNGSYWNVLLAGKIPVQMEDDLTLFTLASLACIALGAIVGLSVMSRLWRAAEAPDGPLE
jgi:RsiW-degrading membrane proteinase PrsW (M82 family)